MNFVKNNIPNILKYSLPKRFQDISPTDFEDFVAQLFRDLGYSVDQTSYSGDYGADLLIAKEDKKYAVQVKRYAKKNKVGVKDVNQVIGAKDFYRCDKAIIITTSDFTQPALNLISQSNVEKWDWIYFQKVLCDTYLDGKDVYSYFAETIESTDNTLSFEITKIEYNQAMKRIGDCTIIYASLNNSGANTNIELAKPVLITQSKKQIEAIYWYEGHFTSGTIYSGSKVDVAFLYKSEQVYRVSVGDRVIFNLYQDGGDLKTYEAKVNISLSNRTSNSNCFLVTFCFGKNSWEYLEFTFFRDNFLLNYHLGKTFVRFYYKYGPFLITLTKKNIILELFLKIFVKKLAVLLSRVNFHIKKNA